MADITKIKRKLSWQPKISFEAGVKKVLKSINNWHDAPLWTPEKINKATKDWFKYLD
jgi:dTDP-D-glucose 4,6-dehydratase